MDNDNRIGRRINPGRMGFLAQLAEVSSPLRQIDFFVFALIIGFGALQFFYVGRARTSPATRYSLPILAGHSLSMAFTASMAMPKRTCHPGYRQSLVSCAILWATAALSSCM